MTSVMGMMMMMMMMALKAARGGPVMLAGRAHADVSGPQSVGDSTLLLQH